MSPNEKEIARLQAVLAPLVARQERLEVDRVIDHALDCRIYDIEARIAELTEEIKEAEEGAK
jgi:hypothetical protein